MVEEVSCLRLGEGSLEKGLNVAETLDVVGMLSSQTLKESGCKKRDMGGIAGNACTLEHPSKRRGNNPVPLRKGKLGDRCRLFQSLHKGHLKGLECLSFGTRSMGNLQTELHCLVTKVGELSSLITIHGNEDT